MKAIILVDGIKCRARNDTARALAKHFSCDMYTGTAKTSEDEYLGWLDVGFMSGVVIESSWQTQRVGHLVLNGSTVYNRDAADRLTDLARYMSAITVHVTSYVDTTILCASMEQASNSLTTDQLGLIFKAHREWEFPDFKVRPVISINPHVDDFIDKLFPAVDEELGVMGEVLDSVLEGY